MKVAVVGATGFLGGELIRLLERHPEAKLHMACSGETAGRNLSDVRPSLPIDQTLQTADPDQISAECDAAFLALPHGQSEGVAEALLKRGVTVIDLGSDFRLKRPADVERWYGRSAPRQALLDAAWYGLPEITGPPPTGTKLVANPGCFATALALVLHPLRVLVEQATVFGVTGSSGSGISPSAGVHHSTRSTGFISYKALSHQHLGEVGQLLQDSIRIDFVPHSLPSVRGIHLTLVLDHPASVIQERFQVYESKTFVDVVDGPVNMGAVLGSNRALIGIQDCGEQTVVCAAIDNLIKGGSGQAIQNLNLLMGWPEDAGLPRLGQWP